MKKVVFFRALPELATPQFGQLDPFFPDVKTTFCAHDRKNKGGEGYEVDVGAKGTTSYVVRISYLISLYPLIFKNIAYVESYSTFVFVFVFVFVIVSVFL